jgi:uncharacterized protein YecT (DUF1311 family)
MTFGDKSMRSAILAAALAMTCALAAAQNNRKQGNCYDTAMAQSEMNRCADKLDQEADVKLNQAYKRLIAEATNDSVALAKFRAFENAWIKYRDTYLDAAYPAEDKQEAYGTIYPTDFSELRRKLTEDQTKVLQQMLSDYIENR